MTRLRTVLSLCHCPPRIIRAAQFSPNIPIRSFASSPTALAGHNKWSKIRHKKGAADAQKSVTFSKLAKEITSAAKAGGTNPADNLRLAGLIANAKKLFMPKDKIQAAIKRGSGIKEGGAALEEATFEALGPGGVALIIEGLTDNKTRANKSVQYILKGCGARSTPTAFFFDRKGRVTLSSGPNGTRLSTDGVFDDALEAGAEDVGPVEEDGTVEVICEPDNTGSIGKAFKEKGYDVTGVELAWIKKEDTQVTIQEGSEEEQLFEELLEKLEGDADVVRVWHNAA
ncbi:DUF28-domain-containing protein [Saitoella complicata NRRL Y-17804]|nr:DUF28-domain-containing protein [Saitoella complicata NRRL Y-17804]ODQ56217.1 DUF28-domain-containing protein [Saitoella complicata NRRL Y-17804]